MNIEQNNNRQFEQDDFLWRYINLHKLISFVFDKKLFFTRLDKFKDPLEGLTEYILGNIDIYESTPDSKEKLNPAFTEEEKEKLLLQRNKIGDLIIEKTKKSQMTQFANCWFVGKKESFAMWNLYSNSDGVAIKYKPIDLLNIVIPSARSYIHDEFKIFLYGFVDYDNVWPFNHYKKSEKEIKYSAFKKDESYSHEREFRFVVVSPVRSIEKHEFFELPLGDISKDNFNIILNPYMDDWKVENIKKILKNFSMDDKLTKSLLKVKK